MLPNRNPVKEKGPPPEESSSLSVSDMMAAGLPAPVAGNSIAQPGPIGRKQAFIDENLEVVRFLVEQGATVNQAGNEGRTPLHVAASCGYLDIARYLLSHGANIAAINSAGDMPLDLAESDAMEGLLKAEIIRRVSFPVKWECSEELKDGGIVSKGLSRNKQQDG
ncbi:Protein phosphatase 1 regulatory subunit 12C [Cricetulus griseus]|uniref:Protein phosphatase 1 regulatory subunit 12C n=1 Tax=Cricetulus griseus TaxID=10029 RepID=G3I7J5_CRIGR|nr:Protein phosphatase 1 regulatory subunit 12C [Cricetulus griseus]